MPHSWYLSVYQNIARISTYDNVVALQLERLSLSPLMKVPFELGTSFIKICLILRMGPPENIGPKTHLSVLLRIPDLCVLATEDFRIKETTPFARCCFRTCLPPDLCVLITEGDMIGRPSIIEGIKVKGGI